MPSAAEMSGTVTLFETVSENVRDTGLAGAKLAGMIRDDPSMPSFVCLRGDLGAGKTVFARGFIGALCPGVRVRSPSYTLINEYPCRIGGRRIRVCHMDAYRIKGYDDLFSTGFYDIPEGRDSAVLCEWPEKIYFALPERRIEAVISPVPADAPAGTPEGRKITVSVVNE